MTAKTELTVIGEILLLYHFINGDKDEVVSSYVLQNKLIETFENGLCNLLTSKTTNNTFWLAKADE